MTVSRVSPVKRIIILVSALLCLLGGLFLAFFAVKDGGGFMNGQLTGLDIIKNSGKIFDQMDKIETPILLLLMWPIVISFAGILMGLHFFTFKKVLRIITYIVVFGALIYSFAAIGGINSELSDRNIGLFDIVGIGFYLAIIGQITAVIALIVRK